MQCTYATLSSVACSALQYFPHYLINNTILDKATERKMCFDFVHYNFCLNIPHSTKK
jgi:hypothetical protein